VQVPQHHSNCSNCSLPRTLDAPTKYPMLPSRLLRAALDTSCSAAALVLPGLLLMGKVMAKRSSNRASRSAASRVRGAPAGVEARLSIGRQSCTVHNTGCGTDRCYWLCHCTHLAVVVLGAFCTAHALPESCSPDADIFLLFLLPCVHAQHPAKPKATHT
jgi:hypothetical protein